MKKFPARAYIAPGGDLSPQVVRSGNGRLLAVTIGVIAVLFANIVTASAAIASSGGDKDLYIKKLDDEEGEEYGTLTYGGDDDDDSCSTGGSGGSGGSSGGSGGSSDGTHDTGTSGGSDSGGSGGSGGSSGGTHDTGTSGGSDSGGSGGSGDSSGGTHDTGTSGGSDSRGSGGSDGTHDTGTSGGSDSGGSGSGDRMIKTGGDSSDSHDSGTSGGSDSGGGDTMNSGDSGDSGGSDAGDCGGDGPDLEVVKSDNADPSPAGNEHFVYTIKVTNKGPGAATGVVLTDRIQHSSWRLWSPPVTSQGSCTPSDADTGDEIVCHLGTLAAGTSATITLHVKARLCGYMTNTAIVSADQDDPNPGNNSDTEKTTIEGNCDKDPDMSIVTEARGRTRVGKVLTYSMRIHQGGPEHGTGIIVTDELDKTVEFVGATASQGKCTYDEVNHSVLCELGEMAVHDQAVVKVSVLTTKVGRIGNTAKVDVNEFDAVQSNNTFVHTARVRAALIKRK